MKPTAAGVAVFSGLAAVVAADALPMDSIPIQCVKICGPVVELTSICNTSIGGNRQRLLRRRRQGDGAPPSIPNRHERLHHSRRKHEAAPIRKENGGKDLAEQEKRDFSIIRQAPTSFPPELLIPPETAAAAAPTRINPVIVSTKLPVQRPPQPQPPPTQDTDGDEDISDEDGEDAESTLGRPQPSAPPLPPPPPSSSSSRDKPSSATATEQRSASNTEAAESWPDKAGNGGDDWWNSEGAEQQCVCQNKSFDVGLITALCASCVDQSGDPTDSEYPSLSSFQILFTAYSSFATT